MVKVGKCCICSKEKILSYEHIPPRSAFNQNMLMTIDFFDWLKNGKIREKITSKRFLKRGGGKFTLCKDCNNFTGSNYGSEYVNWARACLYIISKYDMPKYKFILREVSPLKFFKQVLSLFCSINGDQFTGVHPEVKDFILNPLNKKFQSNINIYMYLNNKNKFFKNTGIVSMFLNGNNFLVSEFNHPPFGFVMSYELIFNYNIFDITFFSNYRYDENIDLYLELPINECNTPLPLDYRSIDKIEEDASITKLSALK